MENFDWAQLFSFISGLISLGAIGSIVFFKYRRKSERLKPKREDIEITDITRKSAEEAMDEVGKWHDKVNELYDVSSEMKREIGELKSQLDEIQGMLTRQVSRKKYAETHLCTVVDCTLRKPPLGTYKSDDDNLDKYVKLNKNIKKNEL